MNTHSTLTDRYGITYVIGVNGYKEPRSSYHYTKFNLSIYWNTDSKEYIINQNGKDLLRHPSIAMCLEVASDLILEALVIEIANSARDYMSSVSVA